MEVLALSAARDGRVDLGCLVAGLGQRGLNEVHIEGGGELLAGFLAAGFVDEIEACVAPVLVGGAAPTPVRGLGVDRLAEAPRWRIVDVATRTPDVWLTVGPTD